MLAPPMLTDRQSRDRADVAAILNASSVIGGERPVTFVIVTIIYAAGCTWVDLHDSSWGVDLALFGATLLLASIVQYVVLRRVLGTPTQDSWRRAVAPVIAILVHQLAWMAASLALLLLLLPGCYIAGRLSAAVGVAVAEGRGVFGSLAESWRRTRASAWSLMLVQLLLLVPVLAALGLVVAWAITEPTWLTWEEAETETAIATNIVLALQAMATWAVAGASYRLTAEQGIEQDAAIFA